MDSIMLTVFIDVEVSILLVTRLGKIEKLDCSINVLKKFLKSQGVKRAY